MSEITLKINKKEFKVDVDPQTPILWVLRDHLKLVGTKFGCGIAQCRACTIHFNSNAIRSCSIPVINKSGAMNQSLGGVVDGIGHAMYGEMTFTNGVPDHNNFNSYRLIRNAESPKVEAYFVESDREPTGLGEPTLPPTAAALANAIYAGLGKRLYSQPFSKHGIELV